MILQAEVAWQLILGDKSSDVKSGGGKTFWGVINGNLAALFECPPVRTAFARSAISFL